MPPSSAARPRTERAGVRVLVTAADDTRVLLQSRCDPGLPGRSWWTLPGGGVDAGEEPVMAACRELLEETSLIVAPSQVLGPLATRTVTHGYSDRILTQHEAFYLVRLPACEDVRPLAPTPRERVTTGDLCWWGIGDLPALTLWDDPAALLALDPEAWPVRWERAEYSTVPV